MAGPARRERKPWAPFDFGLVLTSVLALLAVWPLLTPGLPNTADGPIHFYRAVDLQQAWRDGVLYPRWSANLALGYGTPLFNFAPPLLYVLTMLLNTLGLDLALAMKAVVILSVFIAAQGTYLLGRDTLGWCAGLTVAAAYLYAPYRLRELYIQGNYAQFLALSLYPLILWCYFKVVHAGGWRYVIGGGVTYAALFLSHNISVMLFSPLLAAYVIFWLVLRPGRVAIRNVGISALLGLGLSAFFWLPAFYEQRWLQISQITRGHFDFRLHFLSLREVFSPYVALDYSAVNVYLPLSLGLAAVYLGAIALFGLRAVAASARRLLVFSALVLAFLIFMMLPPSAWLWENLPLLKLAEFPWRLLGVAAVPLSLLAGGSALVLRRVLPPWAREVAPAIPVVCLMVPSFYYLFPKQPFVDLSRAEARDITAYELRTKAFGTTSAGEFLPMWTQEHPTYSPMVADYEAGRPPDKLDRTSLPDGVVATETSRGYAWIEYVFESALPFTVRFNTLWFPGWQVYIDGAPARNAPSSPKGLIEVAIPAGRHDVKLAFGSTPVRHLANGLSLLTLALCPALAAVGRRRSGFTAGSPVTDDKRSATDTVVKMRAGVGEGPQTLWTLASVVWSGGTIALLLIAKEGFIGPHTTWFRLQSPPGQVIGAQHAAHISLGDQAVFLGYDVDRDTVVAGGTITVRLYWQAQPDIRADYRSFVHLDAMPDWATVAQSDSMHPGGIPMTTWPPDCYAWDEHRISIPDYLPAGLYALRAGLYDRDSGQRLKVLDENGQPADSAIPLQMVRVQRAQPLRADQLPVRSPVWLGEGIRLVSYTLPTTSLSPGATFTTTLYWQASEPVGSDYTVFVHLLDNRGAIVAQADGPPAAGRYPTSYWLPGEMVEDAHAVTVPLQSADPYRLAVGLYDSNTMKRLEMRDEQGRPLPEYQLILE